MVQIDINRTVDASVEELWSRLADASSWSRWSPMDESALLEPGSPEPDGVGALRRFRTGRSVSIERVVRFDAPHHLSYTLEKGLPLKGYRADVTLTPVGPSRSTVRWQSSFRPKVPGTGWIYRFALKVFIGRLVDALARDVAMRNA